MSEYNLKNKISVTKDFLEEIISKSWQDIENLKSQISNIANVTPQDKALHALLNNLLTNYYVFAGCLENLETDFTTVAYTSTAEEPQVIQLNAKQVEPEEHVQVTQPLDEPNNTDDFEPFEYFVDFDEPTGEKLTDKDLYN